MTSCRWSMGGLASQSALLFDSELGGRSFWVPHSRCLLPLEQSSTDDGRVQLLHASDGPEDGTVLEALARAIYRHHAARLPGPATRDAGAEWWVQVRSRKPATGTDAPRERPEDEVGGEVAVEEDDEAAGSIPLHFDKDEQLLAWRDIWHHPRLATVTYLSAPPSAAPTVVLNMRSSQSSSSISEAFVSFAALGKSISFDGVARPPAPSPASSVALPVARHIGVPCRTPLSPGLCNLSSEGRPRSVLHSCCPDHQMPCRHAPARVPALPGPNTRR